MAQQQQPGQLAISSLKFPQLTRVNVDIFLEPQTSSKTARHQAIAEFPPARYRIFNASSLKGLVLRSDNGKPASPVNTAKFAVTLTDDGIRANASLHDCWTTRLVSNTGATAPASVLRIESSTFSTQKDHPYALQVQSSGEGPGQKATIRAASTGSRFSNFQLLDAGSGSGFYLFNPRSNTFLAFSSTPTASGDDMLVAEICTEFLSSLGQKDDWKRFTWHFFLDEQSPPPRAYRIVHSSMQSMADRCSLDSNVSLQPTVGNTSNAVSVSAGDESQVWKFAYSQKNRQLYGGTSAYNVSSLFSNQVDLCGLTSKVWRVLQLPSIGGEREAQYLIHNEADGSFLCLESSSGKVSLSRQMTLEDVIVSGIETSVAAAPVSSNLGSLLWKLIPSSSLLADGHYQFIWPSQNALPDIGTTLSRSSGGTGLQQLMPIDRYLSRPGNSQLVPSLSPSDPSDGSQWWNVNARVSDGGTIFYEIRNHMSGELLELSNTGPLLGATDGTYKTKFQIEADGQSCLISSENYPDKILGADGQNSPMLQSRDRPARWRISSTMPAVRSQIEFVSKPKGLTLSTWKKPEVGVPEQINPLEPTPKDRLKSLDDGIYYITNEATRNVVSLTVPNLDAGPGTFVSLNSQSTNTKSSFSQWWYLRRISNLAGNVYQVHNYCYDAIMTEETSNSLVSAEGKKTWPQHNSTNASDQLWIVEPHTNFSYLIWSCQTKGALLDDNQKISPLITNGMLRVTPLVDSPTATQKWNFSPVPPPMASGIYRLRFATGDLLSSSLVRDGNNVSPASVFSNCRVAVCRDGTYTVEMMTSFGLFFLGCDSQGCPFLSEMSGEDTSWKFLPLGEEIPGFNVVQTFSNFSLTLSAPSLINVIGSMGDPVKKINLGVTCLPRLEGNVKQSIIVETPPYEVPSVSNLEDVPSSQVQTGVYRIKTSRGTYLMLNDLINVTPPSLPRSRKQVVARSITQTDVVQAPPAHGVTSSAAAETPKEVANLQDRSAEWSIQSTGNGYYTLWCHSSFMCQASTIAEKAVWPYAPTYLSTGANFALTNDTWSASDIIGASPPYDAARWKLFTADGKKFNFVNKATGCVLQIDGSGQTLTAQIGVSIPGFAAFTLEKIGRDLPPELVSQSPKLAAKVDRLTLEVRAPSAPFITRELDIDSGVFILRLDSADPVEKCLTLPEQDTVTSRPADGQVQNVPASIKPVDLDAYSLDAGLQMWTLLRDDEGWYSVENYLYGSKLCVSFNTWNGRRVYPKDPPGVTLVGVARNSPVDPATTQWRFIQVDGRVCAVNRACDSFCLVQDNDTLKLIPGADGLACCWRLERKLGTDFGLNLAEGVYSLSLGTERSTSGATLTNFGLSAIGASRPVLNDGSGFLTYQPSVLPRTVPLNTNDFPSMISHFWYITRVGSSDSYTINSFISDVCLISNGGSVQYCPSQLAKGFSWQFVPLGSLYVMLAQSPAGQRFLLGADKGSTGESELRLLTPDDVRGPQRAQFNYLWDFTREGVYIQGTEQESLFSSLAALENGSVVATTFKPVDAIKQTAESHRSIWHILPQSPQVIHIFNEHNRLPISSEGSQVRCGGYPNANLQVAQGGSGYSLLCGQNITSALATSEIRADLNGQPLVAGIPQGSTQVLGGKYNTWNFVPITSVVGGPLTTLPRCALGPGQLSTISSVDDLKCTVSYDASMRGVKEVWPSPYRPGLAACRFRLLTYGSIFLAISDLSRRVIAINSAVTVDISEVTDSKHWLQISDNKIVSLYDQTQKFWQIVLNIKDVAERLKPWYVILGRSNEGYPIVLSAKSGVATAAPYDPFDPDQLWKYYDWGSTIKARVIIHYRTGAALQTDLKLVNLDFNGVTFRTYPADVAQAITWLFDVDFTLILQIAGLARHMYLSTSVLAPNGSIRKHLDMHSEIGADGIIQYSPAILENPADDAYADMQLRRGCRFLAAPTAFDLSTKAIVIDSIVAANAPVFLHHAKTYLPVDVAGYLPKARLQGPTGELNNKLQDDVLLDPDKRGWFLDWTPPSSDQLPDPVVYVRVIRSREVMMAGFTDIEYSLFYPTVHDSAGNNHAGVGWIKVTLRMDNETNTLDSVLFNGTKRVGNTNSTFSNLIDPAHNPLIFRLTPSGMNRLHVFVSSNQLNPLQPSCPVAETTDFANFNDWKTADGKQGALDSSTCYQILEADMIQSDDKRDPPKLPPWAMYQGMWANNITNKYGPLYTPRTEWSPQTNEKMLTSIVKDAVEARAAVATKVTSDAMKKAFQPLPGAQIESTQLDRTGWAVSADSFQPTFEPSKVLDGDTQTLWHTQYDPMTTPLPHTLTVDVQKPQLLKGLKYMPRQNGPNGYIGQYTVDLSKDGANWLPTAATGTWANDNTEKTASFDTTLARYVRLTAHTEAQGQGFQWTSCSEINLLVDPDLSKRLAVLEAESAKESAERAAAEAAALSSKLAEMSKSQTANILGIIDAATYGPKDVTSLFQDAYKAHLERQPDMTAPFTMFISNDTMGGDAQPNHIKAASVLFRTHARDPAPTDVVRARVFTAGEGGTISLDLHPPPAGDTTADDQAKTRQSAFTAATTQPMQLKVEAARYGPKDMTQLLSDRFEKQGKKLPWKVSADNGTLGGDPWPNHVKTLDVLYRLWRDGDPVGTMVYKTVSVGEGGVISFGDS